MCVPHLERVKGLTYCGNMICRLIMLATPGTVDNNWPGAVQNPAYRLSV